MISTLRCIWLGSQLIYSAGLVIIMFDTNSWQILQKASWPIIPDFIRSAWTASVLNGTNHIFSPIMFSQSGAAFLYISMTSRILRLQLVSLPLLIGSQLSRSFRFAFPSWTEIVLVWQRRPPEQRRHGPLQTSVFQIVCWAAGKRLWMHILGVY